MKLIDADALKKSVNDKSTHWLNDWSTIGVLAEVDRQPTIDAVPVVRCKDCTYYHPALCALPDGSGANWGVCEKLLDSDTEDNIQTSDEGFCWFAMKAGEACD